MSKWDLLTYDQIYGSKQLDIFKKYGTKVAITDFAILLDGFVLNNYHVDGGYKLNDRTGQWKIRKSFHDNHDSIIDHRGYRNNSLETDRQSGPLPVLLCGKKMFDNISNNESDDSIIQKAVTEYPQTVVNEMFGCFLESLYQEDKIKTTGYFYITDYPQIDTNSAVHFEPYRHLEYEYNGKKYIRFKTIKGTYCNDKFLSDGRIIRPNSIYWIEVEPAFIYIDLKSKVILMKKILVAGIPQSDIFKYLNKYFMPELVQEERPKTLSKKNFSSYINSSNTKYRYYVR